MASKFNSIIESLGVYLPPTVVPTEKVLADCRKEIRFPLERLTGIKSRRMAGETEFSIDLAKKAIADCLSRSKHAPGEIELIVCCNISRYDAPGFHNTFEPCTSVRLRKHFGLDQAVAFDISNACAGMFTGMLLVDSLLKTGAIRCGLVVSGEYITHLTRTAQREIDGFMDPRLACLTLGDAGAAVLLERAPSKDVGFHELDIHTLGKYSAYCIAKASDRESGGAIMLTDAIRTTSVAMRGVHHALRIIERAGWTPHTVQHLIVHQTSRMSIQDAVREINSRFTPKLGEKVAIDNLSERGNTATTSHSVVLWDNILNDRIHSGDHVAFGITGSGMSIGTALYTFDDLPDRMREQRRNVKPAVAPVELANAPAPRVRIECIATRDAAAGPQDTLAMSNAVGSACLANSAYTANQIGLLIYAGVYRTEFLLEPAIAAVIAGELKLNDDAEPNAKEQTFAFDVFNSSIGFLNACYAAVNMIGVGKAATAMIITSEIENNARVPGQPLRGLEETASALILERSADDASGFGRFAFEYRTDGIDAFTAHTLQDKGTTYLAFSRKPELEDRYLECISAAVQKLLALEGLEASRIKAVFPPQISADFISRLSDTLGLDRQRFVDVTAGRQDLFTSSLPFAFQHARAQHSAAPGDIGLVIGVGTGVQAGCALYYF